MGSPYYQHHFIGEFAGDALATANVTARGWGIAPPNGLLYFDTLTGTLRYANGGVWNALGGAMTKHDYGTMHTKQPLVQRYLASKMAAEVSNSECNAQRRVAVDSIGNEYFAHYSAMGDNIFITKVTTDKRIFTFYVPYYVPFDDFCLCMNSLDELVLVYDDGFSPWVSKCPTAGNYLPDGAWTTPVQVSSVVPMGPFAVVAAIDNNDLLWLVYGDLTGVTPPSLTCPMYYAQLNCSVFNTTPTIIIPETGGPSNAYPASWALEIDGADQPHVAYGAGAVAPAHNIWHTYYTLGAWTTPVQMETQTWTSPWENLSMVITPAGRVTVSASQDDSGGYWGVYMDPPYAVGGKDPPADIQYGLPIYLVGGRLKHQISLNDAGAVVHAAVFNFGLSVSTYKLVIFRTPTDYTPDMVDSFGGEFHFYQIFDIEGEVALTLCHWAYYNHNRPNYDYPFIALLRAALIFDTFTPNQYIQYEYYWDALGE